MPPRSRPYEPGRPIVAELAAGGVVVPVGQARCLLLHEREEDRWTLPKGHVEPGESLEACARREIREETGLVDIELAESVKEVAYRFYDPRRGLNVLKVVLYFRVLSRTEEVRVEPIFDRFAWLPWEEAVGRVAYELEREVLRWARSD